MKIGLLLYIVVGLIIAVRITFPYFIDDATSYDAEVENEDIIFAFIASASVVVMWPILVIGGILYTFTCEMAKNINESRGKK